MLTGSVRQRPPATCTLKHICILLKLSVCLSSFILSLSHFLPIRFSASHLSEGVQPSLTPSMTTGNSSLFLSFLPSSLLFSRFVFLSILSIQSQCLMKCIMFLAGMPWPRWTLLQREEQMTWLLWTPPLYADRYYSAVKTTLYA